MSNATRWTAWIAWAIFGLINAAFLLMGHLLSPPVTILLLFVVLVDWIALLVIYNRLLAHWRSVLIAWSVFGLLWVASSTFSMAPMPGLSANAVSLITCLALYALLTGCAALIALVIRRDVSVAYVTLFYAIGGIAIFWMVRSAGGLTSFFDGLLGLAPDKHSAAFTGPLLLGLTCMGTLGFIAVVPYMIITAVREVRGN